MLFFLISLLNTKKTSSEYKLYACGNFLVFA